MTRWGPVVAAWLTVIAVAAAPLTGHIDQQFANAESPMFLPTSVSVSQPGTVAIADGVNSQVLMFDTDGAFLGTINQAGDRAFDTPLSVHHDTLDQLWIVDSKGGRIAILDEDDNTIREVPLSEDVTDVIPLSAGFWAIENERHRITRYDIAGAVQLTIGQRGTARGQFDYPYRAVSLSDGLIAVTDTINGRVVVLDAEGQPIRNIGRYGVQPGEFYRPKGIARDSQGRIWISDSDLGVVQCFLPSGEFVDVLHDDKGEVMHFDTPHGLAVDSEDRLYVVEMTAHRVVRLRIDPVEVNPRRQLPPQLVSEQPRHCTACHVEWMEPLNQGKPTALTSVPDNPPELPHASRSEVCLSCHDGSVADDRRKVWREHGHRTQISPPSEMEVDPKLPLSEGQIVCRTCHSAHTREGSGNVLRDAVFLRSEGPVTNLCGKCHSDIHSETHPGHPIGTMPVALPAVLTRDSDRAVTPAQMTCLTCHEAHGSSDDALLTLPISNNALCLSCHEALTPSLFAGQHRSGHGQLPILTSVQKTVATSFKTRIGAGDQLLCVTCHQTHHAPRPYQLAFDRTGSECIGCHAAQQEVLSTPHDLSSTHPDLVNRFDTRISEGGACAACHGAHGPAFSAVASRVDPVGQCTYCHTTGGAVNAKPLPAHNHPDAACADCHSPHNNQHSPFLLAKAEQVCLDCHEDYALLEASPHRLSNTSGAWPQAAAETQDACLACHRPHGTDQTELWRMGAASSDDRASVCVACHTTVAADAELAMQHPAIPADHEYHAANTCNACHDPHQGVGQDLLIATDSDRSAEMCYRCHSAKENIEHIGHGEIYLRQAGLEATGCQPCHIAHAANDKTIAPMQPAEWLATAKTHDVPVSEHECFVCHSDGGDIPLPAAYTHPQEVMHNLNSPTDPAYLPLFNAEGIEDQNGQIACKTCHLTHGRAEPLPLPSARTVLDPREARARSWHLREFRVGNVCTTCHGEDALRRYIYFHSPALRGGSIESGR
jgi:predicted CXXCH cytochrome family protein